MLDGGAGGGYIVPPDRRVAGGCGGGLVCKVGVDRSLGDVALTIAYGFKGCKESKKL